MWHSGHNNLGDDLNEEKRISELKQQLAKMVEIRQQLADVTKELDEMEIIISKAKEPEILVGTVCRFWDNEKRPEIATVRTYSSSEAGSYWDEEEECWEYCEPHPDYMNWVENSGERPEGLRDTDMILVYITSYGPDIVTVNSCNWNKGLVSSVERYAVIR